MTITSPTVSELCRTAAALVKDFTTVTVTVYSHSGDINLSIDSYDEYVAMRARVKADATRHFAADGRVFFTADGTWRGVSVGLLHTTAEDEYVVAMSQTAVAA